METTYTKEQQAENRKKWVEALRSGKYKQCKYHLHHDNGSHCALGVAQAVLGIPAHGYETSLDEHKAIRRALGLRSGSEVNYSRTATFLNDNGKTFAEIADVAESPDCDWFVK